MQVHRRHIFRTCIMPWYNVLLLWYIRARKRRLVRRGRNYRQVYFSIRKIGYYSVVLAYSSSPGLQYYPYRCFPGCLQSSCLVCVEHGRQSVFSSEVNLYYIVMHVFLFIFLFYLLFLNCYYVLLLPNLVNSKKCGWDFRSQTITLLADYSYSITSIDVLL